ncbi:twin-arginine translocation pathway signal protein [uncultured Parasphingorhabdus sp.]|uniref:twin-arginine translocation pathway signal protein n=1 Tax=uncultured Parasphingorhabdus sp. TaxID=2709694 RepID=UPI0030DCDCD1|tara:strand:- start:43832 stop:44488 length:657 start_codon:yes stop_codon:yes gene_type:complete
MTNFTMTGAALMAAMFLMASGPATAGALATASTAAIAEPDAAPDAEAPPAFIPADFDAPTLVETENFKLVPLGPELVDIDFAAYMSSIEHLQQTFTRSTGWPHQDISAADAMRDMENEQARFEKRQSFAYAVLTPDGTRERGSLYVRPSSVDGHDAEVSMWVTKAEYDAGFDAELYAWARRWIESDWPFEKVAYPGRAIDWESWDALVAASKAGKADQ